MGRHGENIHKRTDGRWEARVIVGYSAEGKAHYRYLYGKTYQEAKSKRNMVLRECGVANCSQDSNQNQMKITFKQLMLEWIGSHKYDVKESTYANYINLLEQHIFPELGKCYVSAITTNILDAFLKEKLVSGRLDKQGGLSPKTVVDIRSVLILGIEYARKQKYPCNVDGKLFYPRNIQPDIRVLTRNEQTKLEKVLFCSKTPLELGILIALYGGLRIGEICALQWGDINFEEGTVHVAKTVIRIRDLTPNSPHKTKVIIDRPKTVCSVRLVPLPSFIMQHIAEFRSNQEHYIMTGTKNFMEPRVCLEKYKLVLKQSGVESLTFHTLRHTFATRCVESGFDIKSLSEILGHANVNTTLQRYVHPSMELKKNQMEKLGLMSIHSQDNSQE